MLQNNNYGVIKHLSKSNFRVNQTRNRLIGVVIILSAFLLTFSSTLGYNAAMDLKDKSLFQGIYDNVDDNILNHLKENQDILSYGKTLNIGFVKNNESVLLISFQDKAMLTLSGYKIAKGSLPEKENEILLEKNYLKEIGEKLEIGDSILLSYQNEISQELEEKEFVICGFLDTKSSGINQYSFTGVLSEAFVLSNPYLATAHQSVAIQIADQKEYTSAELTQKVKDIAKVVGVKEKDIFINILNIENISSSSETFMVITVIAFIVIFACAIVIYNIFYISIMQRIKEYGQLRTIGTTTKQIKQIVLREGYILSLRNIPIGIVLGCLFSKLILPLHWEVLMSLLLAVLSGFITFLTVMISVTKPAKIASIISPIEAIRYMDYTTNGKKLKKRSNSITPVSLAFMNLTRNKKKTILTFLSLALSGTLFIGAASVFNGIDAEKYARKFYSYGGEYQIQLNGNLLSANIGYSDLQINNPLNQELKEELLEINGIIGIVESKYIRSDFLNCTSDDRGTGIYNMREEDKKENEKYVISGSLYDQKLLDGTGIIINVGSSSYEYFNVTLNLGDTVHLILWDGKERIEAEFYVSCIIDNKEDGNFLYLYNTIMDQIVSENCNLYFELISSKGYQESIVTKLKNQIAGEERLSLGTLQEEIDSIKSAFRMMTTALYAFVLFIGIFGIVNLSNTIITNMISRRVEIGIMQAVGLDSKQLRKMMYIENLCLTFGSFILSIGIGGYGGYRLCNTINKIAGLNYFIYEFPIWQLITYLMIIAVVQIAITLYLNKSMAKQTVIERLRQV